MPKIHVSDCPAGFVLDAAVAETRGWRWILYPSPFGDDVVMRCIVPPEKFKPELAAKGNEPPGYLYLPKYSTDIATAWPLVEELKMRCGYSHQRHEPFAMLECEEYGTLVQYADTVPLAITRAYLKARGVTEVPEEITMIGRDHGR